MKIVATISDFGAAANIGGNVEYRSTIIELPDNALIKRYEQDHKWATLNFSILEEDGGDVSNP